LVIPDHAMGLPVLRALSLCTCCRHYPGAATGRRFRSSHPAVSAFPEIAVGSACTSTSHGDVWVKMGFSGAWIYLLSVIRYPSSRAHFHDLVFSSPDQTHIRSAHMAAAPISRLRRAGLGRTRPFFRAAV
jgi:hypothetical protein